MLGCGFETRTSRVHKRLSSHWTKLFLALLVVIQTSAFMADAPKLTGGPHSHGEDHHENVQGEKAHAQTGHSSSIEHHHHDWSSHAADPDNPDDTYQHCHASHCHGSHMPLTVPMFELHLTFATQQIPAYLSLALFETVDTILRPPIV